MIKAQYATSTKFLFNPGFMPTHLVSQIPFQYPFHDTLIRLRGNLRAIPTTIVTVQMFLSRQYSFRCLGGS